MVRYLRGEEKRICRELWEEAFPEDSASFTDYYFTQVLRRNRILADVEKGRVCSMVHLNPYELWVRDRVWRAEYLVGVATRKERRRQGYMRRLLQRAMEDLYAEGMPFCFLMPADEAIYQPFGFNRIANVPRREPAGEMGLRRRSVFPEPYSMGGSLEKAIGIGVEDSKPYFIGGREQESAETEDLADKGEIAAWMNSWLRRHYQVFALRDEGYLQRLLPELASEDGTLDLLYDGEDIVGMESIWGLDGRERRFLYGDAPYILESPSEKPVIMGRILKLQEFLKVIRLRENADAEEVVIPLQVRDDLLPGNHGKWLWHLARETSWLERPEDGGAVQGKSNAEDGGAVQGKSNAEDGGAAQGKSNAEDGGAAQGIPMGRGRVCIAEKELNLGIDELAAWLFGYRVPQEIGEYAELVDGLRGVLLDEVV